MDALKDFIGKRIKCVFDDASGKVSAPTGVLISTDEAGVLFKPDNGGMQFVPAGKLVRVELLEASG